MTDKAHVASDPETLSQLSPVLNTTTWGGTGETPDMVDGGIVYYRS